jgi:hypothetical protein
MWERNSGRKSDANTFKLIRSASLQANGTLELMRSQFITLEWFHDTENVRQALETCDREFNSEIFAPITQLSGGPSGILVADKTFRAA